MTLRRKYSIIFLLSFIIVSSFSAADAEPIPLRLRYLSGFDGKTSGARFGWVDQIMIDNARGEVYLLDNSNNRIVITDANGIFLYQFNQTDAGIKSPPSSMALDAQKGDIYVAEARRVLVLSYRGAFRRELDLSEVPDRDKLDIQSIAIAPGRENLIYLGDIGRQRILVLSPDGKLIRQIGKKEKVENNLKSLHVNEKGITFVDPAAIRVFHFSLEGQFQSKFGTVSSLFGGFSMPVGMAVDDKKEQILIVDANRMMIIIFDWDGNPVFEFGGPNMFSWPRSVAVDGQGHIYVADNTGIIRVFELIEEAQPAAAAPEPEPAPAPPPPAPEPPKDEVTKMVEEEGRLLPVFFDVNSAKLKQADFIILDKDTEWLRKNSDIKINVRGYADERGSDALNLKLSKARAKAVMDYLVKRGVDRKRLKFIGFGRIISTDKSEETMRQNRRVDFLVVENVE